MIFNHLFQDLALKRYSSILSFIFLVARFLPRIYP